MKRIMTAVLAIALSITGFSIAFTEDFTLRNGIQFGDTFEDVKSKETLTLSEVSDDGSAAFFGPGTVASISDSKMMYSFNEEGLLDQVRIDFRKQGSVRDIYESDYDTIGDGLKRKYGEPLGNTGGTTYIITGSGIKAPVTIAYLFKGLDKYGEYIDYDEWKIDCGEYNVKIDQCLVYYGSSYSELSFMHSVSYLKYTDQDVVDAIQEKEEKHSSVDNDL